MKQHPIPKYCVQWHSENNACHTLAWYGQYLMGHVWRVKQVACMPSILFFFMIFLFWYTNQIQTNSSVKWTTMVVYGTKQHKECNKMKQTNIWNKRQSDKDISFGQNAWSRAKNSLAKICSEWESFAHIGALLQAVVKMVVVDLMRNFMHTKHQSKVQNTFSHAIGFKYTYIFLPQIHSRDVM